MLKINHEIWKEIPNYEGHYEISNSGNIRSMERIVNCKGNAKKINKSRILKQQQGNRYLQVTLCKFNKMKTHTVHRLMCLAFLGEKQSDNLVIRHLNGNCKDNSIENLAYGTYEENEFDKKIHGTAAWGEKIASSKLKLSQVITIKNFYHSGQSMLKIAHDFNVSKSTVHRIITGKTWTGISSHTLMLVQKTLF